MTEAEKIAQVCHAANCGLQLAFPAEDVPVAPPWDELDVATQLGIIEGVKGALAGKSPREMHETWAASKTADGWRYGAVKSYPAREHPCLVPYDELPAEHRIKDYLFIAIVRALSFQLTEPTVVERIAALEQEIRAKQGSGWGDPRELAVALTHLEDVQMRFTRGRAKALGVFNPVDLERVQARDERARFEAEAVTR